MGVDEIEGRIGKRQGLAGGHGEAGRQLLLREVLTGQPDGTVGEVDAERAGAAARKADHFNSGPATDV